MKESGVGTIFYTFIHWFDTHFLGNVELPTFYVNASTYCAWHVMHGFNLFGFIAEINIYMVLKIQMNTNLRHHCFITEFMLYILSCMTAQNNAHNFGKVSLYISPFLTCGRTFKGFFFIAIHRLWYLYSPAIILFAMFDQCLCNCFSVEVLDNSGWDLLHILR